MDSSHWRGGTITRKPSEWRTKVSIHRWHLVASEWWFAPTSHTCADQQSPLQLSGIKLQSHWNAWIQAGVQDVLLIPTTQHRVFLQHEVPTVCCMRFQQRHNNINTPSRPNLRTCTYVLLFVLTVCLGVPGKQRGPQIQDLNNSRQKCKATPALSHKTTPVPGSKPAPWTSQLKRSSHTCLAAGFRQKSLDSLHHFTMA